FSVYYPGLHSFPTRRSSGLDEPGLLEVSKLYLERHGEFHVETATSARDALELIKKGNYDAVISDYQMPVMNGIDFLKEVRASGKDRKSTRLNSSHVKISYAV